MGAREGQGRLTQMFCCAGLDDTVGLDIVGERGKRRSTSSPTGFLAHDLSKLRILISPSVNT